jgi:Chitobiase/beta-hexosaminidase C-terminal domain
MKILLAVFALAISASAVMAQDPAAQAIQQQMILQTQLDSQTAQQNAQQAMQQAQQAAFQQTIQQSTANDFPVCCAIAAKPKFSVKSGTYDSPQKVKITDSARGAIIYYTTDGWTPTAASNRYIGPITVSSSTLLQAVAIAPYYAYYGRSLVVSAQYNISAAAGAASTPETNSAEASLTAPVSADGKLTLAQGTPVPFIFAADVSSRTASVGDQIPLVLAIDLKVGNVVVAPKGSAAAALVIQVDKTGLAGAPGDITFQVSSLATKDGVIQLSGSATREGEAKPPNAAVLIPFFGPLTALKHGKDAEILSGTPFTALVDKDTSLASLR